MLLSHDFALRRFGGEPDVIGRTITLDGRQVTVVGVLAHDFRFDFPASAWPGLRPGDVEVYRPFVVSSARKGQIQLLNVVGRLKRGVTLERAQAEIETIRARTAQMYPHPDSDRRTLRIVPLQDQLIGASGYALWILLAAVAFVLLIACANAANLLLARASARRHEIAIRVSVGAGRARILKQLLIESGLLAVLGSAAGLLLASVCVSAIQQINPYAVPRLAEVTLDGRVLGVVLGIAVVDRVCVRIGPRTRVMESRSQQRAERSRRGTHSMAAGRRRDRPRDGAAHRRGIDGEERLAAECLPGRVRAR